MKIIDITKGYTKDTVMHVKKLLDDDKIIILPTDTVYGISTDIQNVKGIEKIYSLKGRDIKKPCSILVSDIDMIREYTNNISKIEEEIITKCLPGPLTIVLEKNKNVPDIVTANLRTVGIRIPNEKFLIDLIKEYGKPILATSCNKSGEHAIYNLKSINDDVTNKIDYAINIGKIEIGRASTVIKVEGKEIRILRNGPISKEEILERINLGKE